MNIELHPCPQIQPTVIDPLQAEESSSPRALLLQASRRNCGSSLRRELSYNDPWGWAPVARESSNQQAYTEMGKEQCVALAQKEGSEGQSRWRNLLLPSRSSQLCTSGCCSRPGVPWRARWLCLQGDVLLFSHSLGCIHHHPRLLWNV